MINVYILGLPNEFRGERLIDFFNNIGIEPQLVFGIDGRINSDLIAKKSASKKRIQYLHGRNLANTEIATALGHRLIYEEFLKAENEWALVLEDDSFPTNNFDLNKFDLKKFSTPLIVNLSGIDQLIKDFDKLPCLLLSSQNISNSESEFYVYRTLGNTFGAYAYLINREAAKIATHSDEKVDGSADWPYVWRNKVSFARPERSLFTVSLENSIADETRSREIIFSPSGTSILTKNRFIKLTKTLLGVLGLFSCLAYLRGLGFKQDYKEKVLIPFLLRRVSSIDK
jgi:GR25 family glycosyltransferase involved in LPS biosynthesis